MARNEALKGFRNYLKIHNIMHKKLIDKGVPLITW